ncbi:MAG: hypothetical protein F4X57_11150 [Chloroflexi bacterium]|nr:hypothetical protein [Chloroflexota bacterium]
MTTPVEERKQREKTTLQEVLKAIENIPGITIFSYWDGTELPPWHRIFFQADSDDDAKNAATTYFDAGIRILNLARVWDFSAKGIGDPYWIMEFDPYHSRQV